MRAPIRARASQVTAQAGPFGKRSPTRVPFPMPLAKKPAGQFGTLGVRLCKGQAEVDADNEGVVSASRGAVAGPREPDAGRSLSSAGRP